MASDPNPTQPVDAVFDGLRALWSTVVIERLSVSHPADDDNLWFIRLDATSSPAWPVQIETHPGGQSPFLIEGDGPGQRRETSDVHDAVATIAEWLTGA